LKVVIDDAVESPTMRYANMQETKELFESGALQSPYGDLIIRGTNLTNKDEYERRFQEVNEFMAWKMEMEKKDEAERLAISDAQNEGVIKKNPTEVIRPQ